MNLPDIETDSVVLSPACGWENIWSTKNPVYVKQVEHWDAVGHLEPGEKEELLSDEQGGYDDLPDEVVYVVKDRLYGKYPGYLLMWMTEPDENDERIIEGRLYFPCEMQKHGLHSGPQWGFIHRDDVRKRDVRCWDPDAKRWYMWYGDYATRICKDQLDAAD